MPCVRHVALLIGLLLCGCDRGGEPLTPAELARAEVLATGSSCLACHAGTIEVDQRIGRMQAPILDDIGARMTPAGMRAFLLDPDAVKAHSLMPSMLHGLEPSRRDAVVDGLVHYLQSLGGPFDDGARERLPIVVDRGRALYQTVGCTACHEPDGMAYLTQRTSIDALSDFLIDPLHVRPSGRMPDMQLEASEADAIAAFLLRDQIAPESLTPSAGLIATLYEIDRPIKPETIGQFEPVESSVVSNVGLSEVDHPDERFAIRFESMLDVPEAGKWTFELTSDDGSWLYIDDELVIDNGGLHGATAREGAIDLKAGRHAFEVLYFELSVDEALSIAWEPPGGQMVPIPDEAFSASRVRFTPETNGSFEFDSELARRGEASFRMFGCASCHVPGAPPHGAPLAGLDPMRGCLAQSVPSMVPEYGFDETERSLLRRLIGQQDLLSEPRSAMASVSHVMSGLNCYACHARDGRGGVDPAINAMFISEADLGDEGRLPPDLTGVGNKLTLDALHGVLLEDERVRPYMSIRMPEYGRAVDGLAELLVDSDALAGDDIEPPFSIAAAEVGHRLVGDTGFKCIECHSFAGHASMGEPGPDLAEVYERIRPGWLRALLLDPQSVNPGTRMPAFLASEQPVFPELLGGDPVRQADAIRSYLSLGASMPIPSGVVVDADSYALEPVDEPILFGVFMDGVSPRTIAVGFPERTHVAWDAEHARMALAWRGEFMNARGTWHQRAGAVESPEGEAVLEFPPGPAVAPLETLEARWPSAAGRSAGILRDVDRVPVFRSKQDGLLIEERVQPYLSSGGGRLRRTIRVSSDQQAAGLWFRVGNGDRIEEREPARWIIDDELVITAESATVREQAGSLELLVPIRMTKAFDGTWSGDVEVEVEW